MKILVTGAAGFLGAEVVRVAAGQGHSVRALIRSSSPRQRVPLTDSAICLGDLTDPASLRKAVDGMDAIIHCAAVTSAGATDAAASQRVNVEGTRALYLAAHRAGVGRWVQISSMSAHPSSSSVYGRTKLAADEVLRAAAPPPEWTILRPSLIYGSGDRGLVAKTVGLLRRLPVMPMLGSGRELLRPVLAADVAQAALAALQTPAAIGKSYMLGGGEEVTLNEFMERLGEAAGARRPLLHLPLPLCMAMAWALSQVLKNPPLTVDNVKGVKEVQPVDHADAVRDLGYAPAGLAEGLRRTFANE